MKIRKAKAETPTPAVNSQEDGIRLHPEYAMEYWKLKAMFEGDPDFEIGKLDDANRSCVVTVKNPLKATLLQNLSRLNALQLTVETTEVPVGEDAIAALFSTNPHFSRLYSFETEEGFVFKAALFQPECMHYFSDDMFSPTSHSAILPQDLARQLFGDAINMQTDLHD